MTQTRFYHFAPGGYFASLGSLNEAIEATKEEGYVWFNFYKPSREELNSLINIGIHPLSIEDCFDEKQIPKIELFPDHTFIIFNSFTYQGKELFVDEVDLFLGRKFLITVSGYNSGDREPLNNITSVAESGKQNSRRGPDFLMHVILDYIVDEKYKAFDQMEDELENAEDLLLNDVEKFDPLLLLDERKKLMVLRKSLFHEREILIKIARKDSPFINEKAIVHYRDIYDHLEKFFGLSETYREIVTSLMELYSSLLNNLMTRMSNDTNVSVRRLTLIATIFMPLTLLASIGGMSEWTMMTGPDNWKVSYPLFILGMAIIAIANYLVIRRMEKGRQKKESVKKV